MAAISLESLQAVKIKKILGNSKKKDFGNSKEEKGENIIKSQFIKSADLNTFFLLVRFKWQGMKFGKVQYYEST